MMPEEGKTDSESSCLLFEKEKRLPERMNYVCGENGLGKQLSPLRKRKAVIRKNALRLQKIRLETLWQGHTLSSDMFFETPSAGLGRISK